MFKTTGDATVQKASDGPKHFCRKERYSKKERRSVSRARPRWIAFAVRGEQRCSLLQRHVNSGAGWSTDSSGRASLRQLLALWYYRTPFHLRILKRHRVVPCVHRQSRGIKPLQARFGVSLGRLQEGEAALAIAPPPPRSAVHTPYSEELRTSSLIMSGSALDIGRVQPQFRERLSTDSSE